MGNFWIKMITASAHIELHTWIQPYSTRFGAFCHILVTLVQTNGQSLIKMDLTLNWIPSKNLLARAPKNIFLKKDLKIDKSMEHTVKYVFFRYLESLVENHKHLFFAWSQNSKTRFSVSWGLGFITCPWFSWCPPPTQVIVQ